MNGRSNHRAVIARLQRNGRWLVDGASNDQITMSKKFGNQACSVILTKENGGYMIKPVTYRFRSTVSHFDYNRAEEERWARNKNAFKALVQTLKRCEVWGSILNKDFILINQSNRRSKKTKLAGELQELIGR